MRQLVKEWGVLTDASVSPGEKQFGWVSQMTVDQLTVPDSSSMTDPTGSC
jgi:hypothetical protein